jgi:hypothetical protein
MCIVVGMVQWACAILPAGAFRPEIQTEYPPGDWPQSRLFIAEHLPCLHLQIYVMNVTMTNVV